ncbi:MAG: transcriptional regulator, LysR family [Bacillota bacterium]|nr:transcriptional regulator, LysR family [Bacillota bacterium]
MTFRHFKIFIAVCNTNNMTAAAKTLFMSQSAVSQAIAELEKYYDVNLFERLSRKLYITQEGEKLLNYALNITRMNTDLENDMKSLCKKGFIRIGASVTVGAYFLPQLITEFKKISPETEIIVFEDNTEKIELMILNSEIDIGLVEGEIVSSDIINEEFMDDELVLICGKNHEFSKLNIIKPFQLEQENFIIREKGSGTRKTFEDIMDKNNLSYKANWICNNADTIKLAVAEGHGISVISKLSVINEVKSNLLLEKKIKGIEFKRKFKLIYHKNKFFTEPINKLMDLCKKK